MNPHFSRWKSFRSTEIIIKTEFPIIHLIRRVFPINFRLIYRSDVQLPFGTGVVQNGLFVIQIWPMRCSYLNSTIESALLTPRVTVGPPVPGCFRRLPFRKMILAETVVELKLPRCRIVFMSKGRFIFRSRILHLTRDDLTRWWGTFDHKLCGCNKL